MRYYLTFGKQITEQILIHRLYVILTSDFPPHISVSCSVWYENMDFETHRVEIKYLRCSHTVIITKYSVFQQKEQSLND